MNVAEDRCDSVWRHDCFVFTSEVLRRLVSPLGSRLRRALAAVSHQLTDARRRVPPLPQHDPYFSVSAVEQLQDLDFLLDRARHRVELKGCG